VRHQGRRGYERRAAHQRGRLGAGGAARAVTFALRESGYANVRILNRTPERAKFLACDLGGAFTALPWREDSLARARLLINATSLGMTGQSPLDLSLSSLATDAVVYDLVYRPLKTALLAEAEARGFRTVDGLGMLLYQAAPAFHRFFGVLPEVTGDLFRECRALLATS
jgi:shikimate dehydrogenase